MARMKPLPKFLMYVVVGAIAVIGINQVLTKTDLGKKFAPGKQSAPKELKVNLPGGGTGNAEVINVGVVTWGGNAGGQLFNEGFQANSDSRYLRDYGFGVNFIVLDDFDASRAAWKSGKVDLLWMTADALGTEVGGLIEAGFGPRVVMQSDWSRGGDVAVGTREIQSVRDLRGKRVAVAFGTPSETFLLWALESAGMTYKDIIVVQAPSAIDAAAYFKAGKVDAAVVWSPDDEDCLANVPGSHVLKSTREATHIIPDVFYAKEEWINSHQDMLAKFLEGFFIGAAEINSDDAAKQKAARILAEGLEQPYDFCLKAINNVRLATYGDNLDFFNIEGNYRGVKGEDVYTKTGRLFQKINRAPANLPAWREIVDTRALRRVNLTATGINAAEGQIKFSVPTVADRNAPAFSSKAAAVNFATGSAQLDQNARTIIDLNFSDLARTFQGARIRIDGHTDNVGGRDMNINLSRSRAQSVATYLVSTYGFDPNRFIVDGKGPDLPVADNTTESGRAQNRRVEFQILSTN